jgi:hypothetical protein
MLRCVARVRTDASWKRIISIIRVIRIVQLRRNTVVRLLLVTDNFFPNSPILVTLMMEVLTRATLRNIPEESIHYRLENCKSYILLFLLL